MDALMALAEHQLAQRYRESGLTSFCNPVVQVPDLPSTEPVAPKTAGSFCEKPKMVPRNAQCPCGSGAKFKRCCGKNAPPVLNRAA